MRRLVTPFADAARAWDRFFFRPADPTPLGAIRIATGLLLFWSLAVTGLDLHGFLGSDGWAEPGALRRSMDPAPGLHREPALPIWLQGQPEPEAVRLAAEHGQEIPTSWAWSLWLVVPDSLLRPAWIVALLVTLAFALGLGSRVTAPLAWAFAVSTARRAPVMLFGFDQIVGIWAFYLAVTGASGQALSLDRLIARRRGRDPGPPRPSVSANLALRLIQLHLCWIYLFAGLAKLQGPTWWDGSALGKLLGNSDFRPFDLSWVAAYPGAEYLLNLATHAALAVEIGYAALIWVKGLRPWVLTAALAMHAGIALTLGLTEFSAAMAVGNLAFVPASWLQAMISRRLGAIGLAGVQSQESDPAGPPKAAPRPLAGSRRASR